MGIPDVGLGESYPDPANIPPGCRFHPRCPMADAALPDGGAGRGAADGRLVECLLLADAAVPALVGS